MTSRAALHAWADALASWTIPDDILAAAPESPWSFPTELFQRRADAAVDVIDTPSARRAAEALHPPGSVLDVGAGGGAAGLAVANRTTALTAVDPSPDALAGLRRRADTVGVPVRLVEGSWPEVGEQVEIHDLVLCHHVMYNVPHLGPFIAALDAHARRRVVLELTERHPLSDLNPLWHQFHGLTRPERPTADDLVAALIEIGIDTRTERWQMDRGRDLLEPAERTALARRRLCLPVEREPEVAAALAELGERSQDRVTVWWGCP